jgi:DNA-binding NarL/FixJ family response regulator
MKFLIADDSQGKRDMLHFLVKKEMPEAEVLLATTTEEATRTIDAHPDIAFAFIDYEIPSKNGPFIIASLKEKNPAAHMALVTSADSDMYREKARLAGSEAFVCTSNHEDQVLRELSDLLLQWRHPL